MSKKTNKHNKIKLICFDCNVPLSNWDKFLHKKYPNTLGYILCSFCQKKREDKIRKELADGISDLGFYDYPKTIAKYKKKRMRKNSKNPKQRVRNFLNLGFLIS